MNPTKRISWCAGFFMILALSAPGRSILVAAEPVDPLVGNWLWHGNNPATFKADGSIDAHGTWEYRHNPEAQRHYRVVWEQGKSVDNVVLAEDGQSAHVTNVYPTNNRARYDVRRAIPDKPAASPPAIAPPAAAGRAAVAGGPAVGVDPFPGVWLWHKQQLATFNADGTVGSPQSSQGTWEFLRNAGAQRRYRVTWPHGKYVDEVILAPDGQTAHVINTVNPRPPAGGPAEYDVKRRDAQANSPGSSPH